MSSPAQHNEVVFLSGVRTGFGAFGGTLKDLSATQLGIVAGKAAVARSGLEPANIDHVVFGNVLQTSADAIYLARHIGLGVGVPIETPALTVNRLCGSGFEAVAQAAHQILLGESDVVLAGGTESMSQAPHVVRGARWGLRLGPAAPLEDTLWEALRDSSCGLSMAETAENLAAKYRIGRQAVDCYAARSQACADASWKAGAYADEVVPVSISNKKTRQNEDWAADEHMRPATDLEALAKLPPYFKKDGVVTAGNASGICDGAAALVLTSGRFAADHGLRPLGRLKLDDMDLVEVNEAFAAQYLAVEQELQLDRERTNVDGGAIALGHPLGASGARITLHLLHALRRRGGRYGLGSACIGGGQGAAVVVEAFSD
jgi:acetyl-CoA acyltransferase 2